MTLKRQFHRILCVDIDYHHGDGVEQAFYYTNDVLVVSFHHYSPGIYPGTGDPIRTGKAKGKGYNVNISFEEGISGDKYVRVFRECIDKLKDAYQPDAILCVW